MSVSSPAHQIPRWSVVGMEGMFAKMWDPPTDSPATPEFITPTNPVPEVMAAAGLANPPSTANTLEISLLHGLTINTWDGAKSLAFYTINNKDVPLAANGTYPGTTIRMPRGCIFHATTSGQGPPPHTIHWHGMEPTPMNDGVGHCSMEIGTYTYQLQPSFIGSYFYHCHRNTMQHFEFGLYGLLLVEPPDAYFATQADPSIPIGHCRDGKRRTAANLTNFPQFPDFVGGDIRDPDPWTGNPALRMQNLHPPTGDLNPHAMTVAYDVEALWVLDDRDSNWSDLAPDARATYPRQGNHPGYDDEFARNPGVNGFFSFNDYRADYWFVTGVAIPALPGGRAAIPAGVVVPAELNSGISGSQVSVEGYVGQTILIRALDAAYNNVVYTFPMDIVIVAWDGRALGVAPYGFNEAYLVPANTPIHVSVGRRFDALIREFTPVNTFATAKFIDTRGAETSEEVITCTVDIPINISSLTVTMTPNASSPQAAGTPVTFTAAMTGNPGSQAPTSGAYEYEFWLHNGTSWSSVQTYSTDNTWNWDTAATTPGVVYTVQVNIRSQGSTAAFDAWDATNFIFNAAAAPTVTLAPDKTSPQPATTPGGVTFTASGQGGSGSLEYEFWLHNGTSWSSVQAYSSTNTWNWNTAAATPGVVYTVQVNIRNQGSSAAFEDWAALNYILEASATPTVTLAPDKTSPQPASTPGGVTFTATGQGGSGLLEYEFWLHNGTSWSSVQAYSATNTWNWNTAAATPGVVYTVQVNIRNQGSSAAFEDWDALNFILQ